MNRDGFCTMPGRPCEHLATLVVNIPSIGQRRLCETCWRTLVAMGMEVRRLGSDVHLYRTQMPVGAA